MLILQAMSDCDTCSELSDRLEEALSNVNMILKRIQEAIADSDQQRVATLDRELESAITRKSEAFNAWLHHREHHGASM